MERSYWENIAPGYDDEIFNVLQNDKKGLIKQCIGKVSNPQNSIIDIGCAVGNWLPVIAPLFKKVMAIDISSKNLQIAAERHGAFSNISFQRVDITRKYTAGQTYDVALCINALLTPSAVRRKRFLQNITNLLTQNGHLILVVPSLESWMLTRIIQQQYRIDAKLFTPPAPQQAKLLYSELLQGNAEIDDVSTKHFLGEELEMVLEALEFRIIERKKIEYDWHTEFVNAPEWLQSPRPFDWLLLAQKK